MTPEISCIMPDGWYSLKTPHRTEKRLRDQRVQKTICGVVTTENLVALQTPVKEAASSQLSIPQNKKKKSKNQPTKQKKPPKQHKHAPFYEVLQLILKTQFHYTIKKC